MVANATLKINLELPHEHLANDDLNPLNIKKCRETINKAFHFAPRNKSILQTKPSSIHSY